MPLSAEWSALWPAPTSWGNLAEKCVPRPPTVADWLWQQLFKYFKLPTLLVFGVWFSVFHFPGNWPTFDSLLNSFFCGPHMLHLLGQFEKWASDKLCPLSKRAKVVKVDVDEVEVEANCRAGKTLSHSLWNAPAYVTQRPGGGGWWSSVLACSLL